MKTEAFIKSFITGLAIVITALIFGAAVRNRNATQDSISVVGLGSKDFVSDEIYWTGSYSAKAMLAKDAYNTMTDYREQVKAFFISKGFKSEEFSFGGVNFEKTYRTITLETNGQYTKSENVFDGYTATQSVSFSSHKNPELMKKIEGVVDQTSELINSGIEFNSAQVQYTYSDLPGLKHSLIQNASKDAKERAQKIVKSADGSLGKLKNASMGVFQITGKGSVEEDSYGGNNDTFNKFKTARITVRLEYELN